GTQTGRPEDAGHAVAARHGPQPRVTSPPTTPTPNSGMRSGAILSRKLARSGRAAIYSGCGPGNQLKLHVFSSRSVAAEAENGGKKLPPEPQNRLERFGDLRRLIGEQADKAGITAPIGAHAPPIPCADQRDPPGFPRPGGSVFWPMPLASSLATASEFACGLAAAARAPRRRTMMASESVCV